MDSFHNGNFFIFQGLHTVLERTRGSAYGVYHKVMLGQKQYFLKNVCGFSIESQDRSNVLLDEAMHKFYFGSLALEQLWGIKNYLEYPNDGLPDHLDSSLTTLHNEATFLLSFLLDQSLYSWRSFLDFYLKYLLFYCTGYDLETMSTKGFKKKMEAHLVANHDERSNSIYSYLCAHVLCNTLTGQGKGWGDYLKDLRDKTTHRKLIQPTILRKKNHIGYEITWPTIGSQNYSELIQLHFENNAFQMIRDLYPFLYNEKWKLGSVVSNKEPQ